MTEDLDNVSEQISAALLDPLKAVGQMLAQSIDDLNVQIERVNDDLAKLRSDVDTLITHVTANEATWSS